MSHSPSLEQQATTRTGAINALAAYAMWGFAPMYFKLLMDIGSDEIFIHRIFWSSIFLLVLVFVMKKWQAVVTLCQQPGLLVWLAASASILAINWLLFIWAVNNEHLLDASLGYFINPLFNVALGMIFFSERLRRNQVIAVFLAVTGVLVQVLSLGSIPVISLVLASTNAIYGV
jgi:chloramphenicol-sensitive protein RarD